MDSILQELLLLKNKKDLDTYYESIILNKKEYPLSGAFEAMCLYNMYSYSTDFNGSYYLYPYKLQKRIEIANCNSSKPKFSLVNGLYTFKGSINLDELEDIFNVLANYAEVNLICKILSFALPVIVKLPLCESFFVALGVAKFNHVELPAKIGQYYTQDYLNECATTDFYQNARIKLKKVIALAQLPNKAKSMYFTLPSLYDALSQSATFDYGIISLQCYKIIEITTKDILSDMLKDKSNEEIYDMLDENLRGIYKREKFSIDYLEIGKIYVLLKNSLYNDDELSLIIKEYFEDLLEDYISYICPEYINNFRNKPAHGEYLVEEQATKALGLLDEFINKVLYQLRRK